MIPNNEEVDKFREDAAKVSNAFSDDHPTLHNYFRMQFHNILNTIEDANVKNKLQSIKSQDELNLLLISDADVMREVFFANSIETFNSSFAKYILLRCCCWMHSYF